MAAERSDEGHQPKTETIQLAGPPVAFKGCRLRVIDGEAKGHEYDLPEGKITIGSGTGVDFRIPDRTISGRHVTVEVTDAGIKVTDLDSTNGTLYLGTRMREAVVQHGAVLMLGRSRVAVLSRQVAAGAGFSAAASYGALVGSSPAMRQLYSVLERIEKVDYTVLIQGETGSGKELVAREIHDHSARHAQPYEVLDCGSVPANLAESELFGHVKGAFTGADRNHDGVFVRAQGGTVFIDELGELPIDTQPKLLRVLESRQLRPVGGKTTIEVNARVIAATNRDLATEVKAGRFREDLYFRLNAITIRVPPLRERREDIPALLQHFLTQLGQGDLPLSNETIELFTSGYDWPGNVRELRNAIVQVVSLGTVPATLQQSEPSVSSTAPGAPVDPDEPFLQAKKRITNAFERDYFQAQLKRADGNLSEAARLSGMDRSYFRRMLLRHGLIDRKTE